MQLWCEKGRILSARKKTVWKDESGESINIQIKNLSKETAWLFFTKWGMYFQIVLTSKNDNNLK